MHTKRKAFSRREFLRLAASGTSALVISEILSACQPRPTATTAPAAVQPTIPNPTSTSPATDSATTAPTSSIPPTASSPTSQAAIPQNPAYLVVARGGEPEDLVNRAIAALGGIEKFVKKGDWVVLKPNICTSFHTYEYASTTNPWVVAAVVKLCLGAGAGKVQVMDSPFGGTAEEAYVTSGIAEQVKAAGGEMVFMPGFKYKNYDIPKAKSLVKTRVFEDVLNADVLINLPIAKHHSAAKLTAGMKNMMGVVLNRSNIHRDLEQGIADLNLLVRPALTLVDAVRILVDHGPTGGNLADVKKLDTVIATRDVVAADSFVTTLFGKEPSYLNYVRFGADLGIGRMDLENLKIEEINVGA